MLDAVYLIDKKKYPLNFIQSLVYMRVKNIGWINE